MHSYGWTENLARQLGDALLRKRTVFAPVTAADGVCRLQPVSEIEGFDRAALPRMSLKKLVLPASNRLWTLESGQYRPPAPAPRVAVVGVAPCDLYALAYLDQAFVEDALYQQRRGQLLLVGAACSPRESCCCPPAAAPPPFDLFIAENRLWVGSAQGEACLRHLPDGLADGREQALPKDCWAGVGDALPEDLEQRFSGSHLSALWSEFGKPCLSCGACSVVCPTCSCYQFVDLVSAAGQVERHRQWDNCFFRDHALVAGGHNFRPGRGERLRFRFEHKYLGFGDLRGVPSCVGCGRCAQACPVGIDLAKVLEALPGGEVDG